MSRIIVAAMLTLALAGCGDSKKKQAKADATVAQSGFTPPSVLSRLDFGGQVERRFRQLDHDGDDNISVTELPSQNAKLVGLDRNHDGKISATEWSEGMLARFDRMDLNHDGSLTSEERERFDAQQKAPK